MSAHIAAFRRLNWLLFGFVMLFLVVWLAPPLHALKGVPIMTLPVHLFAETFSIVVSMLVFAVAWNAYQPERPGNLVVLGCLLLAVGLIDFVHMLSFKGMPDFVTPSGPEKAINFWLSARLLFALGLLAVALRPWQPLARANSRYGLLAASFAASAVVCWLGLYHAALWPRTFIDGQGLTAFKIGTEYVIIAVLLLAVVRFYRQAYVLEPTLDAAGLFAATVILILSELSFTLYSDVADIFNLLGHVYKITAYIFVYWAVFVGNVGEPLRRLGSVVAQGLRAQDRLHLDAAIMENMADGVCLVRASDGVILHTNAQFDTIFGYGPGGLIGHEVAILNAPADQSPQAVAQDIIDTLKRLPLPPAPPPRHAA